MSAPTWSGRFAGKIAVITGAAQGIGQQAALRLAREGAGLVLADRSPLVEDVRNEAQSLGAEVIAVQADLEQYAGAEEVWPHRRAHQQYWRHDLG